MGWGVLVHIHPGLWVLPCDKLGRWGDTAGEGAWEGSPQGGSSCPRGSTWTCVGWPVTSSGHQV